MFKEIVKPRKPAVNWDKIKLLAFDCDGVLTQGGIIYGNEGQELRILMPAMDWAL